MRSIVRGLSVLFVSGVIGACGSPSDDGGSPDTAPVDSGAIDTGAVDTGSADTGSVDTGSADTGSADTGSADTAADGPSDGVAPDGSGDVATDGGTCAPGAVVAAVITPTTATGSPPTLTGGTIVDGFYWATSEVKYGSTSTGGDVQDQVTVSGGGKHFAEVNSAKSGVLRVEYDCVPKGGADLGCTVTCSSEPLLPVGTTMTVSFTATSTQMRMLNSGKNLWTYDKK